MLRLSDVKKENQYIGDLSTLNFEQKFDLILIIGVSTYMDSVLFNKNIYKIPKLLIIIYFIITLNNKYSLDLFLRKTFKLLINPFLPKKFKSKYVLFTLKRLIP